MKMRKLLSLSLAACMAITPGFSALADGASPDIEESFVEVTGGANNFDQEGKFYVDYSSLEEAQEAGHALGVKIAEEGFTLLKNDGILPLDASENKVSIFGIRSARMNRSGFGSGSGGGSAISNLLGEALTEDGFQVNPKLVALYQNKVSQMVEDKIYEIGMENYGPSVVSTYASYNDVAILVFSRTGAENYDNFTNNIPGHADEDEHYLQLDDNERLLVQHVKQNFDKVIVLINSSNIMQIPELAEEKTADNLGVDAILWVGSVGQDGCKAIGDILTGKVNPSGHTSDLWEKDFTKSPTWTNFGLNNQNKDENGNRLDTFFYDPDGNATKFASVEYREGIYYGYKFYETAYVDAGNDEAAYENVLYPFGFGLSYTTFDWEFDNVKASDVIAAPNQTITVRVKVTNTGDVAGKDVVQVYYSAPYTVGGIEKAAVNMAGFAKTKLLKPGESDIVTIQFYAQDMASFDWNDANGNGFMGYELEKGDYTICIAKNSHEMVDSITRTVAEDILCKTDLTTGEEIVPVFTGSFASVNDALLKNSISRATGMVQPAASTKEDRTLDAETYAAYEAQAEYYSYMDKETDPWYVEKLPASWDQAADDSAPLTLFLKDMADVPYVEPYINENNEVILSDDPDSQKWEEFMNQFTWEELASLPATPDITLNRLGAISFSMPRGGTELAPSYSYGDPDGPINAGGVQFPSNPILTATFNKDLAYEVGRVVGNLLLLNGSRGWRGAGADIHRSPFSGRNFEYYSEDGVTAGIIGAEVTKGVTSKGIIAHFKHFFGNDQESFRADYGGVFTWATEQQIREQMAKPFEYIIKYGGTLGLMDSFNRIGAWTQTTNYAVHELLLNKEWNYQGSTESDAWAKQFVPANLMVRGGDDSLLTRDSSFPPCALERGWWDAEAKCVRVAANAEEYQGYDARVGSMLSPTHYFAVRKCAQRLLQTLANSSVANNGYRAEGEGSVVELTLKKGLYNAIQLELPGETNDVTFAFAEDVVWPEGMSFNAETGILSGVPTGEGLNDVSATFTADTWIKNMKATFKFKIESDLMANGENLVPGVAVTKKNGEDLIIAAETLTYGNQLRITNASNRRIMNAYYAEDGAWYHNDDDKSAADIVTLGDLGYDEELSRIYKFNVEGLPEGLTAEYVMTDELGWAARGTYPVNTSVKISGTAAAGEYDVTVTLYCPHVSKGTNPWMRANGTTLSEFVETFKLVVE
ncbi:MAG: glycoside hydrolase family 3 C-terminal domain-containing protein [Lachnospiraceae bacterium]|nr:glycoside hydrolase family 3 C-terminal domain-containing protein [Lachnospiraceae bacterium]